VTGGPRKLSKALLEELSDTRLLLETATHNVQCLIRQQGSDDALEAALRMAEQAVAALRRIREGT
jgi:hypothetical protein